jgi:hypothetical protein
MSLDMIIGLGLRALGSLACLLVLLVGWLRIEQLRLSHPATIRWARLGLAIMAVGAVGLPLIQFLLPLLLSAGLRGAQWGPTHTIGLVRYFHLGLKVADWIALTTGLAFLIAAITADRQPG